MIVWDFMVKHPAIIVLIVFIVVCIWGYLSHRRRNKKQADRINLFEIICPTTSLGLPINKLNDGSFQASSVGIGFKQLSILHRGNLATINRFTMSPRVLFVQMNRSWETTTTITLLPTNNPLASSRARSVSWDNTDPNQWLLKGLPITLAKDESLLLPMMMLSIKEGNEVGNRLDKGETCILKMSFGIFSDKGTPILPERQISLTRSDIKNSLPRINIQTKSDEAKQ